MKGVRPDFRGLMASQKPKGSQLFTGESSQDSESSNVGSYKVEKIVGKDVIDGEIHYQVKWLGYPSSENTWEPIENLQGCQELIREFERNFKVAPPPPVSSTKWFSKTPHEKRQMQSWSGIGRPNSVFGGSVTSSNRESKMKRKRLFPLRDQSGNTGKPE